ncbi:hypothetical protein AVEN_66642-1 [Araneus ventricosus]|uniref:Uncharacterized protein n=1 Tax=Araneus ventricosus TaxID=182803 RepID=A0A4Y2B787_ARAVE|nr:hypothetical protein AVEN_66642-1 [Araneus ventricosus]
MVLVLWSYEKDHLGVREGPSGVREGPTGVKKRPYGVDWQPLSKPPYHTSGKTFAPGPYSGTSTELDLEPGTFWSRSRDLTIRPYRPLREV